MIAYGPYRSKKYLSGARRRDSGKTGSGHGTIDSGNREGHFDEHSRPS